MHVFLGLSSLLLLPLLAQAGSTPSATLPNGVPNPFYPCPATNPSTCPYRCYSTSVSSTGNLTTTTLLPECYTAASAAAFLDSGSVICMKCVEPAHAELAAVGLSRSGKVINNGSATPACQPLKEYFDSPLPDGSGLIGGERPSRCGFKNHRIDDCAWFCAEAQVPFGSCSATNATGTFEVCAECVPTCSSPRLVFTEKKQAEKPKVQQAFSLSEGTCGGDAELGYGEQVKTACPWRCTDDGAEMSQYCSLSNKTAEFTTCQLC